MRTLTERVSVTLPAELKARLHERAVQQGISLSAVMRDVIDNLLAERETIIGMGGRSSPPARRINLGEAE